MAWRITVDHFAEGNLGTTGMPSRVGTGVGEVSEFKRELRRFRLVADGKVFYEGIVTDDHIFGGTDHLLSPLNWGQFDSCCTTLQHRTADGWKTIDGQGGANV